MTYYNFLYWDEEEIRVEREIVAAEMSKAYHKMQKIIDEFIVQTYIETGKKLYPSDLDYTLEPTESDGKFILKIKARNNG